MATKIQPWTEHLLEAVQGGPVEFNHVISEMMAMVPPGQAFRASTRLREWGRSKRGGAALPPAVNGEEKERRIRVGRRAIASSSIWTLRKTGRIKVYQQRGVKKVRVGPNPYGRPPDAPPVRRTTRRGADKPLLVAWRLLYDNGELPREQVVDTMADYVPDAAAQRSIISKNAAERRRGRPMLKQVVSQEHRIRTVKRGLASRVLLGATKTGRFETFDRDGVVWIRKADRFWIGVPPEVE